LLLCEVEGKNWQSTEWWQQRGKLATATGRSQSQWVGPKEMGRERVLIGRRGTVTGRKEGRWAHRG